MLRTVAFLIHNQALTVYFSAGAPRGVWAGHLPSETSVREDTTEVPAPGPAITAGSRLKVTRLLARSSPRHTTPLVPGIGRESLKFRKADGAPIPRALRAASSTKIQPSPSFRGACAAHVRVHKLTITTYLQRFATGTGSLRLLSCICGMNQCRRALAT
jgi:hypothetical protein